MYEEHQLTINWLDLVIDSLDFLNIGSAITIMPIEICGDDVGDNSLMILMKFI